MQGRRRPAVWDRIEFLRRSEKARRINNLKRGDELPSGVQQMVKVYVATKRQSFRSATRWPAGTATRA